LLNPGDEVLLPAPYWVSYSDISEIAGGVPVEIKTSIDTDFKVTPQDLEDAITPKTKMMIYSSPCNPSGSVYNKEELSDYLGLPIPRINGALLLRNSVEPRVGKHIFDCAIKKYNANNVIQSSLF
jgi:alanine-alpha-ketoisovalerate/valine-pyruvate aminotransferase